MQQKQTGTEIKTQWKDTNIGSKTHKGNIKEDDD